MVGDRLHHKKSTHYLEEARKLTKTGSDYGLAQLLECSEDAISAYRKGTRVMSDYMCLRLAQLLDVEPILVIAAANADREKNPNRQREWCQLALSAE